MRTYLACLTLLTLAACAGGGGRTGPGRIPDDAIGAMYTDQAPDRLAACVADAIGGTVAQSGGRLLIASPASGATYDVGATTADTLYPTELIVRGVSDQSEEQRSAGCLAGSARR